MTRCLLIHQWYVTETIGNVWTYTCRRCPATKTRIKRGPRTRGTR